VGEGDLLKIRLENDKSVGIATKSCLKATKNPGYTARVFAE
jgi:hypothetical protein